MPRLVALVVVTLIGSLAAGRADALPIAFSDSFNPADVFFTSDGAECTGTNSGNDTTSSATCATLQWLHTLTDFDAATDVLDTASLTFWLFDDGDNAVEKYNLTLDLFSESNHTIEETGLPFSYSYDVLSGASDGHLLTTLTLKNGDFWFARSHLTASGTRGEIPILSETEDQASVPEPATLFLIGSGIAAYAARRRTSRARPA